MDRPVQRLVMLAVAVLLPSALYAQGSIMGTVRDASGAVLPGVTVEASSPVLIEKVRSAVTDGTGQYRIVELRPGIYTVTFALPGFGSVRRGVPRPSRVRWGHAFRDSSSRECRRHTRCGRVAKSPSTRLGVPASELWHQETPELRRSKLRGRPSTQKLISPPNFTKNGLTRDCGLRHAA